MTTWASRDPPSPQHQGFPYRPSGPGSCRPIDSGLLSKSEPATNLCVTSERISTRKVSVQDRTKAET